MRLNDRKIDKAAKVALKTPIVNLVSAVSLTDRLVGCIKPGHAFKLEGLDVYCAIKAGAAAIDAVICPDDAIVVAGALGIDATPEKFLLALSRYRVGGLYVEKAAETAIVFTANHVVTASKYGIVLVQVDNAGAITTKTPGATQTTAMAYASAAAALAALPAASSGKLAIGYIAIHNNAGDWTANTDDLTDGSDLTTAEFVTYDAVASALDAPIDYVGGKVVPAVLSGTLADVRGSQDDSLLLLLTTDGSGALTNGSVQPSYRPQPLSGDGSHE